MDDIRPLLKLPSPLDLPPPNEIKELIRRGAMFFCNHSGGKDSQSMFHYLHRHVPAHQITVIHALLPEYVSLEKTTGQVMMMPSKRHGRRTLEQITGVIAYPQ